MPRTILDDASDIGYVSWEIVEENEVRICNIIIPNPEDRGYGYGTRLLKLAEQEIIKDTTVDFITLEVDPIYNCETGTEQNLLRATMLLVKFYLKNKYNLTFHDIYDEEVAITSYEQVQYLDIEAGFILGKKDLRRDNSFSQY